MLNIDASAFHRDGFLVIPNAFSEEELVALRSHMDEMIQSFDFANHKSTFETSKQKQKDDEYFLESGDKIRFFLEADILDDEGNLKCPRESAINKVGHALHDLDDVFKKFSYNPLLLSAVKKIGLISPTIVQSMFIFKSARTGGVVTPHQDSSFVQTNPATCVGTWVSLEDATRENGCMWAVPGSHKKPVTRMFNYYGREKGCTLENDEPYDITGAVPIEVTKGTLVLLHGGLVHYSGHNHSDKSRHAYTLHIVDQEAKYLETNWLRRENPEFPFFDFEEQSRQIYGNDLVDTYLK